MEVADKVRDLAEKLCEEIAIRSGHVVESTPQVIANLLRAELKPLLDAAWEVKGPRGTCDENCDAETCPYMRLAAELRNWRKE